VCVRVCVLGCCVCLFVWTVVRKRGGEAETQQGSFVERAPYDMFYLSFFCYIDVHLYVYVLYISVCYFAT